MKDFTVMMIIATQTREAPTIQILLLKEVAQ